MYKEQEHPYKILNKVISSGSIPSVILLYGSERFMIDWAVNALKKALINPVTESLDFSIFNEKESSEGDIIAACETLPFMSERKVVVAKDLDLDLPEYISNIPETTLLILVQEKADKRKGMYKAIEKVGLAYDFGPLDEATLVSWVHKRIANIDRADIIQFANTAGYFDKERGYNLYNFEGDLAKAKALYEGKEVITLDDLLLVSSIEDEVNAFKLLDAAFSNRKGEAMKLLDNIVKKEQASKQMGALLKFHGLLCSQLEIMVEARERKEEGALLDEMGINSYRLKKAIESSAKLSTARLKAALSACYRIEREIKSGRTSARLAMELFIAKI